jgi:hypothetical protein
MEIRIVKPSEDADYYVVNPHEVLPPEFSGSRAALLTHAAEKGWGPRFERRLEQLESRGGRFHAVYINEQE